MPKKLINPKTEQIAIVKLSKNIEFRTIKFIKKEKTNYYQVMKNRKKIDNFQSKDTAIRRMMAEANYELQNLFYIEENSYELNTLFNHEN